MKAGVLTAVLTVCVTLTTGGVVRAGLPTAYDAAHVPHRVVIPLLDPPSELHTDLDRPPWTQAAVVTGNLDWRRIRTADLPVWTYLFYDGQSLWVACRNETTPGMKLKNEVRGRDEDLRKDDHFQFWLDAGRTGRTYYKFFTNAAGVLYDAFLIDASYDSSAAVKTAVDDRGWTAAMRIPLADVGRPVPTAGTVWSFNAATRTGTDHSWAPVLGGYHTPEQFSDLVFGTSETVPARMRSFRPIRVGDNVVEIDVPSGVRYILEGIDGDQRLCWREEGAVRGGRIDFTISTESIRHVNFSFPGAGGQPLLSFWRPVDSRPFLDKLPGLKADAEAVRSLMEHLPAEVRGDTEKLLKEVKDFSGRPAPASPQDWDAAAAGVVPLERRLVDARLLGLTRRDLCASARFAVALASPMDKVMIQDFPCPGVVASRYKLALARRENEAMQVVVIPCMEDLKNVSVTVTPPTRQMDGWPFSGKATVSLVGHVKTRPAGSYLPEYVGWYPDPILDFQRRCDAARGEHVSFWIDVQTRPDTSAGDYRGTIRVTADGCEAVEVGLDIRVWDFTLPEGTHLRNAFTYDEANTKRFYRGRWSKELAYRYYDFILDHRLNIDGLYGKHERDVEMLAHGARRGMNAFNLFYVSKGTGVEVLRQMLAERMPPLEKAGLDRLAYLYGFDEVNDDAFPKMREIFGAVRELYPSVPRMTTGYDITFGRDTGLRDYVDIWVPLIPRYDMNEADRLRAEGKEMWWYLCVGPRAPYPNWFVETPAIEARLLMGAMSFKYRVGGVLYFMMNQWRLNDEPVGAGPYTEWFPGSGKSRDGVYANGDGSIFCPGPDGPVTTIRFENIRDGLEDYEYLYMLGTLADVVRRRPATLETAAFLERARALLAVPDGVVESSSRFTSDSRALYDFRTQVAETILQGGRLMGGNDGSN